MLAKIKLFTRIAVVWMNGMKLHKMDPKLLMDKSCFFFIKKKRTFKIRMQIEQMENYPKANIFLCYLRNT